MKKNKSIKITIMFLFALFSLSLSKKEKLINNESNNQENNINIIKTIYGGYHENFPDSMILEFNIEEDNYKLFLPIYDFNGTVTIYWGDGSNSNPSENNSFHTYANKGKYIVEISNNFKSFKSYYKTHMQYLTHVHRFNSDVTDLSYAFMYAKNLIHVADITDNKVTNMAFMFCRAVLFNQPLNFNTSNVTDMEAMFYEAPLFNQPLNFNTSNVTNMKDMFYEANSFNQPLNFDTSNVTDMEAMLMGATNFNSPLSFSDTSNVTNMLGMFCGAYSFNQPLNFNTSNVTNMSGLFENAFSFNQPLNFDISNVTNMEHMFAGAYRFNKPLNFIDSEKLKLTFGMFKDAASFNEKLDLNTANVTNMESMFAGAYTFNQPLNFDTSNVTSMYYMFYDAHTFNRPLNFDTSNVTNMEYMFAGATSFNQAIDNFDFTNVLYFSEILKYANVSNSVYNNFIRKFVQDKKNSNKSEHQAYLDYGVWNFKSELNNKDNFEWLKTFGIKIEDLGYAEINISPVITWQQNNYTVTYDIKGLEFETEKQDIINQLTYEEIQELGIYYVMPKINLTGNEKYIMNLNKKDIRILLDLETYEWDNHEYIYDGTLKEILISNFPNDINLDYTNNKNQDAGTYNATAAISNYSLKKYNIINSFKTREWKILKSMLSLKDVSLEEETFIYDGSIQNPKIINIPQFVSYKIISGNNKTDAGVYKLTISYDDNLNYTLEDQKYEFSYTIKKIFDLENIKWGNAKIYYDGLEKEIKLIDAPSELNIKYTGNKQTNPGKYNATYSFGDYDKTLYSYKNAPVNAISFNIIKKININDLNLTWKKEKLADNSFKMYVAEKPDEIDSITYSGNINNNVGRHKLTATLIYDKEKYELESNIIIYDWEIASNDVSLSNNVSKVILIIITSIITLILSFIGFTFYLKKKKYKN